VMPDVAVPQKQLLAWEKELIGFYLSDHPLKEVLAAQGDRPTTQIVELPEKTPGQKVRIVGMVAGVRRITTKNNKTMAIVDLEDLTGNIELVAFPDCYEQHAGLWEPDTILEVVAKLERRNEQLQLVCETASEEITQAAKPPTPRRVVHVKLPTSADIWADIKVMQDLDAALHRHEGDDEIVIHLPLASGTALLRSRSRRVEWGESLRRDFEEIVGKGLVRVQEPEATAVSDFALAAQRREVAA